jgi:hypothetical protein
MKSIITNPRTGKFCHKKVTNVICLLTAIALAFIEKDAMLVGLFLTAGGYNHLLVEEEAKRGFKKSEE